ncbi:MAG: hypothetical protein ACRDH2_13395 [Anaerolineales bacterium]
MRRLLSLVWGGCVSAVMVAACGAGQATNTPPPTEATQAGPVAAPSLDSPPPVLLTPTPRLVTVVPSPTLGRTPTPADVPATPDPNQGVGDVIYEDKLDGSTGWDWAALSDEAASFSISGGQLNAVMMQPNLGPRFTVGPEVKIGDQQVSVIARANLCYENDEYGLMFRFSLTTSRNYNGYIFKLSCGGQARLELMRDEQTIVLVDWTPSPAIVRGAPAENRMLVWAAQAEMRFYVNDKYLFSANDPTYSAGFYGFYLRDRTAGGLSVSFADLVAREVRAP